MNWFKFNIGRITRDSDVANLLLYIRSPIIAPGPYKCNRPYKTAQNKPVWPALCPRLVQRRSSALLCALSLHRIEMWTSRRRVVLRSHLVCSLKVDIEHKSRTLMIALQRCSNVCWFFADVVQQVGYTLLRQTALNLRKCCRATELGRRFVPNYGDVYKSNHAESRSQWIVEQSAAPLVITL